MKGIIIDPVARTVADVEINARKTGVDISSTKKFLGLRNTGIVEPVRVTPDAWLVVDEEGLMKNDQSFFRIAFSGYPFAGKALLLGCTKSGLGFTDCPVAARQLEQHVHWMTATEVKLAAALGVFDTTITSPKGTERIPVRPSIKEESK